MTTESPFSEFPAALADAMRQALRDAYDAGYADGLTAVMQTAQSMARRAGPERVPEFVAPTASVNDCRLTEVQATRRDVGNRAPRGSVPAAVEAAFTAHPEGITANDIATWAAAYEYGDIAPASVRARLRILESQDRARRKGERWFSNIEGSTRTYFGPKSPENSQEITNEDTGTA